VKNESEILAAKIVNEFNFFERDIESASLTEEVCKEYIYSNFTKKLTHAYLDKLIGLISAVRKKDKLYVISRSKHKEEIFDSIINAVYTIVKLLETKIPKREMQMTTFEHLLGSAGFTIGHTSINVKFKKVLTKDDIYQQLLNNKLFGIKEMYLVCPLQNKIFKLDYEEVKSEQKKLTD
jgi:integrase